MNAHNQIAPMDWSHRGLTPETVLQWRMIEAQAAGWPPLPADEAWGVLDTMAARFNENPVTDDATYQGFYARLAQDEELADVFDGMLFANEAASTRSLPADLGAELWANVTTRIDSADRRRQFVFQGITLQRVWEHVRTFVIDAVDQIDQVLPDFSPSGGLALAGAAQRGPIDTAEHEAVNREPQRIGPVEIKLLDESSDTVRLGLSLVDPTGPVVVQIYRGTDDEALLDRPEAGWDVLHEVSLSADQPTPETIPLRRTDLGLYSQIRVIESDLGLSISGAAES